MKSVDNNSLSSSVSTAHDTFLKSNNPVYCEFNGDHKKVNYSKSDNVILQLLKKILYLFDKMRSKDTSISYSGNKKMTLILTPSNDVVDQVKTKSYAYDEPWYFSHIDPTSNNTDTSLKILSQKNYDVMMTAFENGVSFLNELYDEHDKLIDTLEGYFDHDNNALRLKDVPKDVLKRFEKLEMINQMFINHVENIKEMEQHQELNLTNYKEYDKTLPPLASESFLKASSSNDKTMTLGLAASKNMNDILRNNIDAPKHDFYLSVNDPNCNTKTDTMKLLSEDDFLKLVERVGKGMNSLETIYNQHVSLNKDLDFHLDYHDGQFLLKNVDPKDIKRLQKLDMLTKVFLDFIDTVKKFDDETNADMQDDMAKENHA